MLKPLLVTFFLLQEMLAYHATVATSPGPLYVHKKRQNVGEQRLTETHLHWHNAPDLNPCEYMLDKISPIIRGAEGRLGVWGLVGVPRAGCAAVYPACPFGPRTDMG
jgi:hypothetical protein